MNNPTQQGTSNGMRRIAVVDIETVPLDPTNPVHCSYRGKTNEDNKDALYGTTGRIVCIGILFDDGQKIIPEPICDLDETKLLERFWAALRPDDLLVGHFIMDFDMRMIQQRSWALQVKPSRPIDLKKYSERAFFDTAQIWNNWGYDKSGTSLDEICGALGLGEKTGHGKDVAGWWANRDYDSIVKYCMDDVRLEYALYCRMNYRQPLGVTPIATSQPAAAMPAKMPAVMPGDDRELVMVGGQPQPTHAPASLCAAEALPTSQVNLFGGTSTSYTSSAPQRGPVAPPPATIPPYHPAAQAQAATPAPAHKRSYKAKKVKQITYIERGGAMILTGDTFPVKDVLKETYGARAERNGEQWAWVMTPEHYGELAALCSQVGIRLAPSQAAA